MLSKNSSVSCRNACRSLLSKFGKSPRRRDVALQVAQHQPLAGEVVHERPRLRVRQHPPHLLLEHRRLAQLALRGERQQLVVRNAAPQEERQPRRQLEIGDARRRRRRRGLGAEQELRVRQDQAQAVLDAGFERALLPAASIERA